MSFSPVTGMLRQATRRPGNKLNILTFPTHERYETYLSMTGHNFYAIRADKIKDWKSSYAPVPDNYVLLDKNLGDKQLLTHINADVVLSQNKFAQYPLAQNISNQLHIPLITLEHTLPAKNLPPGTIERLREFKGNINVFISDYSIEQWGFSRTPDVRVIKHCVDTNLFKPNEFSSSRDNVILSVVNDWINRDWCCNFQGWTRITKDLPVRPVGDTAGLSKQAKDIKELADIYANSRIFINTSTVSPVPSSLLEAMSSGCAVVSTATCMIPEIIENGVNGFLANDEAEMRRYLELLLEDESLANELGKRARQTIIDNFGIDRFVSEWNNIFEEASKIPYIGVK